MASENCDVFLSFRGEIRRNFTCHFYTQLKRQGFQPFMDSESLHLGDEIHASIKKAIKHSKSAIVILSDEFASSKHCLNELVLILERNRTSKYFIIPVFYYVETDDVKQQLGKFGAAFEHIKKQHTDDKVEEWITALASIGGILGKEIKEQNGLMESTIIEDMLETFEQKFYDHYPESQQRNQVTPPTTSTTLDIVESPAASTSRPADMGSFRLNKKGWKCKKFVRELSSCVCVLISFIIIFSIYLDTHPNTTKQPALRPPPPLIPSSIPLLRPPAYSTQGRGWVTVPPPPAFF